MGSANDVAFSWAIMSLFAWLLPHVSMEVGEYHRALHKSPLWSSKDATMSVRRSVMLQRAVGKANIQSTHASPIDVGIAAVRWAAIGANLFCIFLIIGAACGVALTTKNLDKRMVSIVTGLSRLLGATVIFALSWNFPEWLQVYHIRPRRDVLPVTRSVRALKFNVFVSVAWQYCLIYFFLLPFYCGAGPLTVPVSAIVGLVIGAIIDVCAYWGRKHVKREIARVRHLMYAMIFVALAGSAGLFASGCNYIHDVWGNKDHKAGVLAGTFFAWLIAGGIIHFLLYKETKSAVEEKRNRPSWKIRASNKSTKYKNVIGEKIVEVVPQKIGKSVEKTKAATKSAANAVTSLASKPPDLSIKQEEGAGGVDEEPGEPQSKMVGFEDQPQAEGGEECAPPQVEEGAVDSFDEKENGFYENESAEPDASVEDPTYCSLIKSRVCGGLGEACCCIRCCVKKETSGRKVLSCAKWTLWTVLSCFSLYFIAINIGATYQQDVVRAKLPSVKHILYDDMNDIEVCACDGDGTEGSLNETSYIKTFPSKDAAREAGFLILHCGPCAACSTWPNIKYEYTTRKFLAAESARCARKSLTGGAKAVHECLTAPPISWDEACGTCWTVDVLCAKSYCAFNFLQSTMINTMTNFAVGIDQVTAASCEEANCEAFPYPENFVECSGATRRRMNVTSSIKRSKYEECANVDVAWEVLFPGE